MFVRHLKALALLLAGALLAPLCFAADAPLPVLPKTFGGWILQNSREVSGASLAGDLGDNFPILVESGLSGTQFGAYSRVPAGGTPSVAARMPVRLYRFRDASGAYSAYTFLRTPDLSSSDLTEKSAVGRKRILAIVGNLLLDLSDPGAASLSELKTLVTLLQQETPPGDYPTLWQSLPGVGFVRTSDRYLLGPAAIAKVFPLAPGDWLGFSQGVEAESARYNFGGESATLLLAVYPTPQLARKRFQEMQAQFGVRSPAVPRATIVVDLVPRAGPPAAFGELNGLLISLVSGTSDPRVARALFDRVQYETSVTWNQPSWTAKEPPFLVMLVNILIGTGLLLVYAFFAGIIFAVARLVVKRLAPGRVFDRDQDVELLQLGLSSKPIEAKDFLSPRSRLGTPPLSQK